VYTYYREAGWDGGGDGCVGDVYYSDDGVCVDREYDYSLNMLIECVIFSEMESFMTSVDATKK
jgi:hypothetical protein